MPKVSVVVLCYQHAAYVLQCLDSVVAQHYTDWELIIADDASKDNSVALIQAWLKVKTQLDIKTNFHQTNSGLATMLNECIALARGQYLKLISADDLLEPEFLQETVHYMEQSTDEQCGIVYTNAQYIKEDGTLEVNKFLIPNGKTIVQGSIRKALSYGNFIPAPAVLIKKAVFDVIGPYHKDTRIDDYDCWLRASKFFHFYYIPKALIRYRIHAYNISHQLDLSNDLLAMLIHYNDDGTLTQGINQQIKDKYYQGLTQLKVIQTYCQYPYRDPWMAFCLKNKIPYKLFRLINKFIGERNAYVS